MSKFTIEGRITYDPIRGFKQPQKGWLTVELNRSDEVSDYLRWHLDRQWWQIDSHPVKRAYSKPPHSSHVSIIRGERLLANADKWGTLHSKKRVKMDVIVDPLIRQTTMERDGKDHFFFVDVVFPEFNELRAFYGLQTERDGTPFHGHMTFARVM